MLAAHPEAFTSDADTQRTRPADSYGARLGLDRTDSARFVLGAWRGTRLVGAVGCERDMRLKVMHIAHLIGMMVRADVRNTGIGAALLDACVGAVRSIEGITLLTLSVTSTNAAAVRLYERAGFTRYGSLPHAILVGTTYHSKDHMLLML
jgi:ribosomal protein S18 acetylase RimI-like enzyme